MLTVTLDWLSKFFPLPDLIKIDVEGSEHLALEGGSEVLRHGPVILAEVSKENRSRVKACLDGYQFFLTDGQSTDAIPNNLVAIPQLNKP